MYSLAIILFIYISLRLFVWSQALTKSKPAFWTRELIQIGNTKAKPARHDKSSYRKRSLIGTLK